MGVGLLAAQIPGLNGIPDKVGKIIQSLDVPSLLYSAAFAVKGKIPNLQELLKRSPAPLSQKVPLGNGLKGWLIDKSGQIMLRVGDPRDIPADKEQKAAGAKVKKIQAELQRAIKESVNKRKDAALPAKIESLTKQLGQAIKDAGNTIKPEPKAHIPSGFGSWADYLDHRGKDARGKRRAEVGKQVSENGRQVWRWKAGPGKNTLVHAHHIVMKSKFPDISFVTRQLLRSVGIDPYTDVHNLAWAPNWNHSRPYAEEVERRIEQNVRSGKSAVERELRNIAEGFVNGDFGQQDLKGRDDDP